MEADYQKSSHPSKLTSSLVVIEDSELVKEQYVAVGVGEHYYGHSVVDWHHFELDKNPKNEAASGPLEHFATSRTGKLTSVPFQSTVERQVANLKRINVNIKALVQVKIKVNVDNHDSTVH